jgi:hypothetical protein
MPENKTQDIDYSTRLLYKATMHEEIYNSNLDWDLKLFLQSKLEEFQGDFNKLMEDILEYSILPEVENYENAALIRDYLKNKDARNYQME